MPDFEGLEELGSPGDTTLDQLGEPFNEMEQEQQPFIANDAQEPDTTEQGDPLPHEPPPVYGEHETGPSR